MPHLRLLIDVIGGVVSGSFNPDLTRSGPFGREAGGNTDECGGVGSWSCGSEDEDDLDVFVEERAIEREFSDWQPV